MVFKLDFLTIAIWLSVMICMAAGDAFEKADLNADGNIDRAEFG